MGYPLITPRITGSAPLPETPNNNLVKGVKQRLKYLATPKDIRRLLHTKKGKREGIIASKHNKTAECAESMQFVGEIIMAVAI